MIQKITSKFGTFVAALALLLVPLATPVLASAQTADITNSVCKGTSLQVSDTASCDTADASGTIDDVIGTVVNVFSVVVGVIAVIMIIWAGLRYITSGGDSTKVGNAKNTMVYAIIGLVVVALAQFIVKFVLNKVTGV